MIFFIIKIYFILLMFMLMLIYKRYYHCNLPGLWFHYTNTHKVRSFPAPVIFYQLVKPIINLFVRSEGTVLYHTIQKNSLKVIVKTIIDTSNFSRPLSFAFLYFCFLHLHFSTLHIVFCSIIPRCFRYVHYCILFTYSNFSKNC